MTRDMSAFCSTRFVRFWPEGSHAAGGPDEPGDRCDWAASKRNLSCAEAGALLGMSDRHFRLLRAAYEAHGAEGIRDRRRGRASGRRAGVDEIAWVIEEFRTRYFDFTAKHFHEAIHGRAMADGTPFS